MSLISQAVPDWHARILSQFFRFLLCKATILDPIIQTSQETCSILHTLFMTNVGTVGADVGHVSALLSGGHLEGATSARRILLKNQRYLLPLQARQLSTGVACRL